ncbi:hypothetical protein N9R81_03525 [Flavobacteriales bacterium]|nr:hypothetical protein [Flavobacteriales bacterium]
MRKQYLFIAFIATIAILACNTGQQEKSSNNTIITESKSNSDSEMTLLMRTMFNNYVTLKDSIINGNSIDRGLFSEVHRIHRAVPTDSTIMGPVFEGMATNYLNTVDSLLLAESKHEMYFNISVQSCLGCHQEFCPGPMDKIKKLTIKPKQE